MPIALTNQFVRPTGAHKILSLLLCWPVFGSAIACTTVDIKKGFLVFEYFIAYFAGFISKYGDRGS
jgi:hypothetical protein